MDIQNRNDKWKECTQLELQQLMDYHTFQDLGDTKKVRIPEGHKKIGVHLVYAIKHDGRHKARLVANGHLTDIPLDRVYSGVVSLKGIRLVAFLAMHNDLKLWSTDIGNTYLEAHTKEKLAIIGGGKFKSFGLENHLL